MFFHQVLHQDLGCASYVVGDAGEAIVVDPRWDVEAYQRLADEHGARIVHVVDTHDHADHVSGRGRLGRRTGASLHRARELRPGAELRAGAVVLRAVQTPGHRPEHLSFAVADTSRSPEACLLLAGDSLLVGDVARPDLAVEPSEGASALHVSLGELLALGDHVELWPAHVGGSLCGGGELSLKTSSTVGVERRCNPVLRLGERAFVASVGSPGAPKPPNTARIAQLNAGSLGFEPPEPPLLTPAELRELDLTLADGVTVLDGRTPAVFDQAHLTGSIVIPLSARGVGTRAGWAVEADTAVVLVAETEAEARRFVSLLHAVALWNVLGIAIADPSGWRRAGLQVETAVSITPDELAERVAVGQVHVVDVRDEWEYRSGHVPGSTSLPLHRVPTGRFRRDGTLAVVCARGGRAATAASLLRRAGEQDVIAVSEGGVPDLPAHGLELEGGAS